MSGPRVLVISRTLAGERMSAPGIRALNVARTLAASLPQVSVTFAVPNAEGRPEPEGFAVETYGRRNLPGLIRRHDVIVAQYVPSYAMPFIFGKRVVLDFFANYIAEWLELGVESLTQAGRAALLDTSRRYLNLQLSQADLVLAANERQRDLWLGLLSALGRITPAVYDADPSLRSLVAVAPFGVRPQPAVLRRRVLKGVFPGIAPGDFVFLWNGGVLRWYDPITLLRAFRRLSELRPHARLFFLGTKYPIPDPIEGRTLTDMLALSESLDLTGRAVFFNEGWLPYDATADYLVEADAGVSAYYSNLETHFAYRVRLVDLIWAETPVLCTEGDTVSDLVAERRLGLVVPERDEEAVFAALLRMVDDPGFLDDCRRREREVKAELSWERCLEPLLRFCRELPQRSPSRSVSSTLGLGASYAWGRLAEKRRRKAVAASSTDLSATRDTP